MLTENTCSRIPYKTNFSVNMYKNVIFTRQLCFIFCGSINPTESKGSHVEKNTAFLATVRPHLGTAVLCTKC